MNSTPKDERPTTFPVHDLLRDLPHPAGPGEVDQDGCTWSAPPWDTDAAWLSMADDTGAERGGPAPMSKRSISIPRGLDERLAREPNASRLITHLLGRYYSEVIAWREANPVTKRFLGQSLVVTGNPTDEFSPATLMTEFGAWLVFTGEDAPELSKQDILADLSERLKDAGMRWSDARGTFQFGRLV